MVLPALFLLTVVAECLLSHHSWKLYIDHPAHGQMYKQDLHETRMGRSGSSRTDPYPPLNLGILTGCQEPGHPAITVHFFLVCGLANALDETEDNKVSDDILTSEEDQVNQDPSDSDVDSMGDPFSDEDSEDQDEED